MLQRVNTYFILCVCWREHSPIWKNAALCDRVQQWHGKWKKHDPDDKQKKRLHRNHLTKLSNIYTFDAH